MQKSKKKNVLLITETLPHYRVGLFNMLHDYSQLTVAHGGDTIENTKFSQKEIYIKQKGPFLKLENLPDLSLYDVVILTFNIRILNFYKLLFKKRNYKLLLYGIGVSASYKNKYDQNKKLDFIRKIFIKKSDGAIFYEHYPVIKYQSYKIDSAKLHVAYNTVMEPENYDLYKKKYESFIFIGALYKAKKIYDLLEAYFSVYKTLQGRIPKLEIIGDGEEYSNIKTWIKQYNLQDKVLLKGKITEDELLKPIFSRAIACISPGQAGLSVQKSFSYGVPFITSKDAITGGELFSIIHNENGFLYNGSIKELTKILYTIASNEVSTEELSHKAYLFYKNFRHPKIWNAAFKKAIE